MIKQAIPKKNGVSYTRYENIKEENHHKYVPVKVGNTFDKMNSGICIPSAVHGYSLAVEYFRDWFMNKMDPKRSYFKTVFINGRHIIQDYMRYSEGEMIKRSKPAVAITPVANLEHDREEQDTYLGGKDMIIGKFNHQQCFFKDHDNNQFIGMGVRELEVEFNVRVRVESKAQQMDIYREMEMNCKIGATETDCIAADFHIPSDIIKNIAIGAGFKLDKNEEVKDPIRFIKYLNAHSDMPVLYKLRTITGRSEFFVRPKNVYCHVAVKDKLSYDDGEKEGQLENNFHVDMNATLHMWVPSYYVIMSTKPVYKYIRVLDSSPCGLYTIRISEVPDTNRNGWNLYIRTNYEMSLEAFKDKHCIIDISSLTYNTEIKEVILDHLRMGISPSRFIEIKLIDYNKTLNYTIRWDSLKIDAKNFKSKNLLIGVYIDTKYYNQYLQTKKNLNRKRYERS